MTETKIETKIERQNKPDLDKQMANVAFTVRKIKNWLEQKLGADIDGDGKVGSGPTKKVLAFLCMLGVSYGLLLAGPANTNIAVWYGTEALPLTYIDASGQIYAPAMIASDFTVNTNVTVGGTLTVTGTINGVTINATMITNVIAAGQVLPAVDGGAITNIVSGGIASLDASKLTANIGVARLTNAVGVTAATITITNYGVGDPYGTNIITFFGTVSYP